MESAPCPIYGSEMSDTRETVACGADRLIYLHVAHRVIAREDKEGPRLASDYPSQALCAEPTHFHFPSGYRFCTRCLPKTLRLART